jgi:hypothetical protein
VALLNSLNDVKSALETQVGGAHYKGKTIQPVEYIHANNLNFLEGCIVKRITRWREKGKGDGSNTFQDLLKIKHEVDLLIAMESKYSEKVMVFPKVDE